MLAKRLTRAGLCHVLAVGILLALTYLPADAQQVRGTPGTPVDDRDYQVPFAFTGRLNRITVDTGETSATGKALQEMQAHMQRRD